LNSIPAIIESLPPMNLSASHKREFAAFGRQYGNHSEPIEARAYLRGTYGLFCGLHSESFDGLKEFRDKMEHK
jgi:hypothetical protein